MRMYLRAWLFQRRHQYLQLRKPALRVSQQHLPAPLRKKLPSGQPGNLLWRRGPKQVPWLEKVLHPSQPVVAAGQIPPLSRSPRLRPCSWREGLVWIPWTEELSVMTTWQEPPLAYRRVGSHLANDAAPWLPGSDGMSEEGPVTGEGLWSTPRPIDNGGYVGTWTDDHEHKSYCERWSDRGHLHGHCNHLGGGEWPSVALNRRPWPRGLWYRT